MKVRVLRKKSRCFFFSSRKVSEDAWVERFSANQRFRSFQFFVVAWFFFRTSSDSKPPKRCWNNSHKMALFKAWNKLIPKTSRHKTWDANKSRPARKDFMIAEMKAESLSCNDPSHDGHANSSTRALLSRLWQKCDIRSNLPWCLHVLWWRSIPLKPFYYDVRSLLGKKLNLKNLMEELLHQLRLVLYPMISRGFTHPRWCRISSINSSPVFIRPLKSIGSKHH